MAKTLDQDFPPMEGGKQFPQGGKQKGVYRKLMAARIELQGRKLNKSGHNKFAGYYYFELGDFLPAVQEIFAGLSLCGVISYGKEEAWLTITDMDDGSYLVICSPMSTAALKGCHEVQNLGAVQTYIRRYLWVTAMEIVEHDALDSTTGSAQKESFKSEPRSAWDKLDAESQEWMLSEAMAITVMTTDGDIEGAFNHLEGLRLDIDDKTAFWSRLDSTQRSALKAYSAIVHAGSLSVLEMAWKAVPKHSISALTAAKDKRKAELAEPEQAAA
jgi:hypothetical protein